MANIRDVAELAEVSIAAVSRILSCDPAYRATERTKNAVFEAAAKLNYSVKPSYRKNPAESKKKTISCIINLTSEKHDDSFYTAILEGLKLELSKHNYTVEYIKSQYDIGNIENLRTLLKPPTKGLILMTTPTDDSYEIIKQHGVHVVGIDTSLSDIDNVRYNRFEAGCNAMQYLIENGHKKIAFVGSYIPNKFALTFGRYDAYHTMMRRYQLPVNSDWTIDCLWQRQLCYDYTVKLINLKDRPTAIFFASDYMAMASLSAMYANKVKVPDDISIIGISNIDEAKYLNPPLTTIAIPQKEIGQIAAITLLSRINGDTTVPKQIYVPTNLVVRSTVKKI